jgi:CheY-like chemotaxis protein
MQRSEFTDTQAKLLRSAIRGVLMAEDGGNGQAQSGEAGGAGVSEEKSMKTQEAKAETLRALIVEDSPRIALRLAEMLSLPGKVEVAAQAATEAEAIAACGTAHFDLAVVDLQLASGTGFGVIGRLRRDGNGLDGNGENGGTDPARRTVVIVLTNHAIPALEAAAIEAGADVFLDKSRDFQKIQTVVEELLAVKYPGTT